MHERGREILVTLAVPAPEAPDDRWMNPPLGYIAPIRIGKFWLVFTPMAEEHNKGPDNNRGGNDKTHHDEQERFDAVGVRLVGKSLLFRQDRVKPSSRMKNGRMRRGPRNPLTGKRRANLRVAARIDRRNRHGDSPVITHRQRPIERTVSPCAHVASRRCRCPRGYGQVHGRHDMAAFHAPPVPYVLPIQLGHVIIDLHEIRNAVAQRYIDAFVAYVVEHIHGAIALVERVRRLARPALFSPGSLERDFGKARAFRRRGVGRFALAGRNLHRSHRKLAFVRRHGVEVPPHGGKRPVEIERPGFDNGQGPVRLNRRVDHDARTRIAFRLGILRNCKKGNA